MGLCCLPLSSVFFDGQIVPDLASKTLLRMTPVSDVPITFWEFPYYLAKQDVPDLSYAFPVRALESAISPNIPGFF